MTTRTDSMLAIKGLAKWADNNAVPVLSLRQELEITILYFIISMKIRSKWIKFNGIEAPHTSNQNNLIIYPEKNMRYSRPDCLNSPSLANTVIQGSSIITSNLE